MLDRDHEMNVEYVDAFYGLNKETHMQARHYALYMEDNNSDQFLAFHLKDVSVDLKAYLKVYMLELY